MKRILHLVLALLCAIALLSSCEKAPFVTMTGPRNYSFTRNGGTQSFAFSCNRNWTVSSTESWIRVSPSSGTPTDGDITVTITCSPNTTYDPRTATLTVKVEELMETITVTQETGLGLIVSPTTFDLTNAAQDIEIELQKNVQYSVAIDESGVDWIKQGGTKSLSTDKVTFHIAANKSYDDREGKITFKQTDGDLVQTVTVRQSQTNGLFITTPTYDLSNEAHTLSVEVKSNVQFEVTPQVDWIKTVETKALTPTSVVLSIEANESYDNRTGTVIVKQTNGDLSSTITINQHQTDGLFVTPTSAEVSNQANSVVLEIIDNVSYNVVIPDNAKSWISVQSNTKTKALVEDKVVLAIAQNTTYDDREASVTIKQVNGPLAETVKIKQGQNLGLFATKSYFELSNAAQTAEVEVKANVEFTTTTDVDWIKIVETKALKASTIVLSVAANETYDDRVGKVNVKQINGDLEGVITIVQRQTNGLFVDKDTYEVPSDGGTVSVDIQTNAYVEVVIPEKDKEWIERAPETKGLEAKTLRLTVKANPLYVGRSSDLVIREASTPIERPIHISQLQLNHLTAESPVEECTANDTTLTIKVKSNIGYTVSPKDNWMSVNPATVSIDGLDRDEDGLASTEIKVTLTRNSTYKYRTSQVDFSADGLSSGVPVEVKQSQFGYVVFEGYKYKTIAYGDREWFAENLRAKFGYEEGEQINSYGEAVYPYVGSGWTESGGEILYSLDWMTYRMVKEGFSICPEGWHVSTSNDWKSLFSLNSSTASTPFIKEELGGSDEYSFGGNYGYWHMSSFWFEVGLADVLQEWAEINKDGVRVQDHSTQYGPFPSTKYWHIRCVRGPIEPDLLTLPVMEQTTTTANLRGEVMNDPNSSTAKPWNGRLLNANYSKITKAGFKYGTSKDNLSSTVYSSDANLNVTLSGLKAGHIYYFQSVAEYEGGSGPVYGNVMSFRTYDGTMEYQGKTYFTTIINGVEMMTQNLQAATLNDGTPIPYVKENNEWATTTSPAQCIQINNEAGLEPLGRLYNKYTIETNKICPEGWRLPTNKELVLDWDTRYNLYGTANGLFCLANNVYWANPTYCNNLSGFSALPSEMRNADGSFTGINDNGNISPHCRP